MTRCIACNGCGVPSTAMRGSTWRVCVPCDGVGRVWLPGGPSFGAIAGTLDMVDPGQLARIGPDASVTVKVFAHNPKPAKGVRPIVTMVRIVDEWDDSLSEPIPMPSCVGVHSKIAPTQQIKEHDGVDIGDPLVKAQQARNKLI